MGALQLILAVTRLWLNGATVLEPSIGTSLAATSEADATTAASLDTEILFESRTAIQQAEVNNGSLETVEILDSIHLAGIAVPNADCSVRTSVPSRVANASIGELTAISRTVESNVECLQKKWTAPRKQAAQKKLSKEQRKTCSILDILEHSFIVQEFTIVEFTAITRIGGPWRQCVQEIHGRNMYSGCEA